MCLHKAGVRKELLETVKAKKLAYYGPPSRNKRVKRDNTSNNAGVRITKSNYITPKKTQKYYIFTWIGYLTYAIHSKHNVS